MWYSPKDARGRCLIGGLLCALRGSARRQRVRAPAALSASSAGGDAHDDERRQGRRSGGTSASTTRTGSRTRSTSWSRPTRPAFGDVQARARRTRRRSPDIVATGGVGLGLRVRRDPLGARTPGASSAPGTSAAATSSSPLVDARPPARDRRLDYQVTPLVDGRGPRTAQHFFLTQMNTYPEFTLARAPVRIRLGLVGRRRLLRDTPSPEAEAVVERAHGELGVLRGDEAADS